MILSETHRRRDPKCHETTFGSCQSVRARFPVKKIRSRHSETAATRTESEKNIFSYQRVAIVRR